MVSAERPGTANVVRDEFAVPEENRVPVKSDAVDASTTYPFGGLTPPQLTVMLELETALRMGLLGAAPAPVVAFPALTKFDAKFQFRNNKNLVPAFRSCLNSL